MSFYAASPITTYVPQMYTFGNYVSCVIEDDHILQAYSRKEEYSYNIKYIVGFGEIVLIYTVSTVSIATYQGEFIVSDPEAVYCHPIIAGKSFHLDR